MSSIENATPGKTGIHADIKENHRIYKFWLASFLFVAIGSLWLFGSWYYSAQKNHLKTEAEGTIKAIAEMKVSQIVTWRNEQIADATVLSKSPFFVAALEQWLAHPEPKSTSDITMRLELLGEQFRYKDIIIYDSDLKKLFSLSAEPFPPHKNEVEAIAQSILTGNPEFTNLHQGADGVPHMSVVASVFSREGKKFLGSIVIQLDTNDILFPLIQNWPTPSLSAETLLVSRDGEDVVFLNELRHVKNTVLKLRIPLTKTEVPAVKAVLGQTGLSNGLDYRGVPVISYISRVPNSPWYMVSKVDSDEVYAEWNERANIIVALFVIVAAATVFLVGGLWQRASRKYYASLLKVNEEKFLSEERYHTTLMSVGDGVIATDEKGHVVLINPIAEELTGWKLDEARGKPLEEVFHIINEDTRMLVENPMREVIKRGVIVGLANHTLLIARDGTERPIADSAAPIRDEQGKIIGVILVFSDKSHEHQMIRALKESESNFKSLFSGMLNGLAVHEIILDERGKPADYRFLSVNPAFERLTGLKGANILGRRALEIIPNLEKFWIDIYGKVATTGEPAHFENFAAGIGKHFEIFAYNNAPMQFACIIQDITERKWAEETREKKIVALTRPLDLDHAIEFEELFDLRELQSLQDKFAQATGVASIITRIDGTPITKPSNFTRLCMDIIRTTELGLRNCLKSDAVIGGVNPDGPIIQPCMSCGLWDAGASIVVGERHIANWLIGQVRDGTQTEENILAYAREIGADEREFLAAFKEVPYMSQERFKEVAQALYTLAGQMSSIAYHNVSQARFIADQKRVEKEKEILQASLLQAQKMESIGRLAGGVAHDFNNMLGVIIGHAQMAMTQENQSPSVDEDLREILKAAQRSADITRQLLAFARKQNISPKSLDLNETISNMLKMLGRLVGEDIDLVWKPGPNLWRVRFDPSQVDQILANLVVNSRDAITGQGTITIETKNLSLDEHYTADRPGFLPGEYIQLTVSDSGAGMPKEVKDKIFEPFYTTKALGKGTGLGLATVYGIVKQNDGYINVYTEQGKGTTIKMFFPRLPEPAMNAATRVDDKAVRGGTETILVVEDESAILNLATRILRKLGYEVVAANSPQQALDIAGGGLVNVDLLVTDVVMPNMNGRELANILHKTFPRMECLYMSGYTSNVIAHSGVLEEGVNFIPKPFTMENLGNKVREILDKKSAPINS